jgi:hypothetical protein
MIEKSKELDQVLETMKIPRVEQSDPTPDQKEIRFTVDLCIQPPGSEDPFSREPRPYIYIFFTRDEFQKCSQSQTTLEKTFKEKIEQRKSDPSYHSKIWQEREIWRAMTVSGETWVFDQNRDCWTKVPGVDL